jgi:hypothetical protein
MFVGDGGMILREKKTIEVQLQTSDQIKDSSGKVDYTATKNLVRGKVQAAYGYGLLWFTKQDDVNGEYIVNLYLEKRL